MHGQGRIASITGEVLGYDQTGRSYLILTKRPSDGNLMPLVVPQNNLTGYAPPLPNPWVPLEPCALGSCF